MGDRSPTTWDHRYQKMLARVEKHGHGKDILCFNLIFYLERLLLTVNGIFYPSKAHVGWKWHHLAWGSFVTPPWFCGTQQYILGKLKQMKTPISNKTSGLPDPPGGATCGVFHRLLLTLLPHQRPAETMKREDKTLFRQGMPCYIVPLFTTRKACQRLSSSLLWWCSSCRNGRVLGVVQLCFFHDFWVRQISELYILPAAVAILCNTAALTPSDHSWCISLSWIGERQSKWQVTSMQLLARTYGDYYEGAGKASLESACGADNWAIAFFDNF